MSVITLRRRGLENLSVLMLGCAGRPQSGVHDASYHVLMAFGMLVRRAVMLSAPVLAAGIVALTLWSSTRAWTTDPSGVWGCGVSSGQVWVWLDPDATPAPGNPAYDTWEHEPRLRWAFAIQLRPALYVYVPAWALLCATVAGGFVVWRTDLKLRRTQVGACKICGYDRAGLPVCPECGTARRTS